MLLERQEEALRERARQHEKKLLELREQKLQQCRDQLREELSEVVQNKYENFKVGFEAYYQQQLDSLKLERDMKLAELDELADRIRSTIGSLQHNQGTLTNLRAELEQGAEDALAHLDLNR